MKTHEHTHTHEHEGGIGWFGAVVLFVAGAAMMYGFISPSEDEDSVASVETASVYEAAVLPEATDLEIAEITEKMVKEITEKVAKGMAEGFARLALEEGISMSAYKLRVFLQEQLQEQLLGNKDLGAFDAYLHFDTGDYADGIRQDLLDNGGILKEELQKTLSFWGVLSTVQPPRNDT